MQEDNLLDDGLLPQKASATVAVYPSLLQRLSASLLDGLTLIFVAIVLSLLYYMIGCSGTLIYPINVLIPLSKYWIEAYQGTTPGKRALGIVLVDYHSREPIGWGQAFKRNMLLLLLFPLATLSDYMVQNGWYKTFPDELNVLGNIILILVALYGLSCLFILVSPTRRSLLDYFAKTVCVHKQSLEA